MSAAPESPKSVPWFGARKVARSLMVEIDKVRRERDDLHRHLEKLGALTIVELDQRKLQLKNELHELISRSERERIAGEDQQRAVQEELASIRSRVVATEEIELLQEDR